MRGQEVVFFPTSLQILGNFIIIHLPLCLIVHLIVAIRILLFVFSFPETNFNYHFRNYFKFGITFSGPKLSNFLSYIIAHYCHYYYFNSSYKVPYLYVLCMCQCVCWCLVLLVVFGFLFDCWCVFVVSANHQSSGCVDGYLNTVRSYHLEHGPTSVHPLSPTVHAGCHK